MESKSNIYLRFIGTAATQPYAKRNASGILFKYKTSSILIDCGENITRGLLSRGESIEVDSIFITHMHGDHWYGILGLLDTLNKNNRVKPLYVYGPSTIYKIKQIVEFMNKPYGFKLHICKISQNVTLNFDELEVTPYVMNHGTICYGYLFTYPIKSKLDPSKFEIYGLKPGPWCKMALENPSFEVNGKQYNSEQFIKSKSRIFKLFVAGDSTPVDHKLTVDCLVHECTYYDEFQLAALNKHTYYLQRYKLIDYYKPKQVYFTHISEKFNGFIHNLKDEDNRFIFVKDGFYTSLDE